MMAGSLLVGASWTPTPRERALLAKVGAARLYSSLVSWILGFVQFDRVMSAGSRARSEQLQLFLGHTSSARAVWLSLVAMPVNLAAQRSRSKAISRTPSSSQVRPRHTAQLDQVRYEQLRNRLTHQPQPCLCCLSAPAVSADPPLPDTRSVCRL